jgi:N-methylhydantoinase B
VRGDILLLETGGGGGHGHPFDRPVEAVLNDVLDGFVSVEAAADRYGVVISDGRADHDATNARRADRPVSGAFHRRSYVEHLD